jgi:hypothetical protein
VLVLATVAIVVMTTTRLSTYSTASAERDAPPWVAVCDAKVPRSDRVLLAHCAQADGFVAWVRKEGGNPPAEVHFALAGRFGVLIVKLGDPVDVRTPRLAEHVTVTGALVRARNGMREIQAWVVD